MNSSASASADKAYDEERLAWGGSVTKKYLQLPRLRRVSIYLLLADVFIVAFLVHAFEPLITLLVRNEELFGSRLVLPLNETLHPKPPAALNKIPRILHQTSATEIIPDKWIHLQKSCKETYSEFEYKVRSLTLTLTLTLIHHKPFNPIPSLSPANLLLTISALDRRAGS